MRPILREQVWPEAWNLIPTSPIRVALELSGRGPCHRP